MLDEAEGVRSQAQEIGLAEGISIAIMLLEGLCFLHDKLSRRCNTFEGWQKWDDGWKKVRAGRKDVRGIEKGTKSVK